MEACARARARIAQLKPEKKKLLFETGGGASWCWKLRSVLQRRGWSFLRDVPVLWDQSRLHTCFLLAVLPRFERLLLQSGPSHCTFTPVSLSLRCRKEFKIWTSAENPSFFQIWTRLDQLVPGMVLNYPGLPPGHSAGDTLWSDPSFPTVPCCPLLVVSALRSD